MSNLIYSEKPTTPSFQVGMRVNEMRAKQRKVYELICDCIKNKQPLTDDILQQWFMERIVKPRNRSIEGKFLYRDEVRGYNVYEKIPEYQHFEKYIKETGRIPYYYFTEARSLLKYHIGGLVVRGALQVLPIIRLTEEHKEIENKEPLK